MTKKRRYPVGISVVVILLVSILNHYYYNFYKNIYYIVSSNGNPESNLFLGDVLWLLLISLIQLFAIFLSIRLVRNQKKYFNIGVLISCVITFIMIWIPFYKILLRDSALDINFY